MKKPRIKKKKGYYLVYTNRKKPLITYSLEGIQLAIRFLTCTK